MSWGENPALVNEDAEGKGWLMEMTLANPADAEAMMTREEYDEFAREGE